MTRLFTLLSALVATLVSKAAFADQPRDREIGFQEAATPVMREITHFHNDILMWIISGIVVFVMILLVYVMVRFNAKAHPEPSKTTHNVPLEIIWTLVPVLLLLVIAIPSFRLLFFQAVTPEAEMTLKVTGNQWNWTYEYPDNGDISFTSVMDRAQKPYLLRVDNPVFLPVDTVVRVQVTASDVLHSFAVPAFGIKTDAVPGRLNETWVKIEKPGTYFGQCSELCGKDHGFMPIEVRAVPKEEFASWVVSKGGKMPSPETAAVPGADATQAVSPASPEAVTRQSDESAKKNSGAKVPGDTTKNIQSPDEPGHPVEHPNETEGE